VDSKSPIYKDAANLSQIILPVDHENRVASFVWVISHFWADVGSARVVAAFLIARELKY
jgi:hypothetical protein